MRKRKNSQLSELEVRKAKPEATPYKLYDKRGLFLLVMPGGGKLWRFRYRYLGKEKLLSMGAYPDIGLADARERRDAARKLVANNIDPSVERKAATAALYAAQHPEADTFEAVAREWFGKYSPAWAPSHSKEIIRRLERDVFPTLGTRPVGDITERELLEVLRRIEARGVIETAHRINQVCGQVFRYAIAIGKAERNPAGGLRGALAPVPAKHFAALTQPADVAGLVRAINGYGGTLIVRCALKFSLYTFARPGEVRHAEWSEVDWDNALWRIPAEKMKLRREHLVPLSQQVVKVLHEIQALTGQGKYIFPGRGVARPLSENAITAALRYMGYDERQMTAHGFRTIASTLLHEQGWASDVIERQLAHAERNAVRGAYNRAEYLDERRRLMQHWSDYLDRLAIGGVVIPLPVSA